jgi:UDPglucose 6-dehydrogenase
VGYGGSCFPKDVQALMSTGEKNGVPMGIITAAEDANARQKKHLVTRIKKHFGNDLKGRVFGMWGLAFKPNTDDMREAPAITIIEELTKAGATVRAFDPVATENARKVIGEKVTYCSSAYEVTENADALILVTEWNEFRHPDFEQIKKELKSPVIFDGRNVYNPEQLRKQGFTYYGVGRG